jgi:hypothetical protein
MSFPYIPKELLHIILDYDGRIKFRKGKYMNQIQKKDDRYDIIRNIINKKLEILEKIILIDRRNNDFYFEVRFDSEKIMGLCYDYHWTYRDKFEICFYSFKNSDFIRIRSYI